MVAADLTSEPLLWDKSLLWLTGRRASAMGARNYRLLAAEYGLTAVAPLLDPAFLGAVGHHAPPLGYGTRTVAMQALFGDILPRAVIERESKALFNRAFMGESTRAFASSWDGSGVDTNMVDVGRLRQEWLSEQPSAVSSPLLQAAWLHRSQA